MGAYLDGLCRIMNLPTATGKAFRIRIENRLE